VIDPVRDVIIEGGIIDWQGLMSFSQWEWNDSNSVQGQPYSATIGTGKPMRITSLHGCTAELLLPQCPLARPALYFLSLGFSPKLDEKRK
jgi:hypothetical protein